MEFDAAMRILPSVSKIFFYQISLIQLNMIIIPVKRIFVYLQNWHCAS